MKPENIIKREKGVMIIAATALMTEGIQAFTTHEYSCGIVCIITSLLIFFLREHYKFRKWYKLEGR